MPSVQLQQKPLEHCALALELLKVALHLRDGATRLVFELVIRELARTSLLFELFHALNQLLKGAQGVCFVRGWGAVFLEWGLRLPNDFYLNLVDEP